MYMYTVMCSYRYQQNFPCKPLCQNSSTVQRFIKFSLLTEDYYWIQ